MQFAFQYCIYGFVCAANETDGRAVEEAEGLNLVRESPAGPYECPNGPYDAEGEERATGR